MPSKREKTQKSSSSKSERSSKKRSSSSSRKEQSSEPIVQDSPETTQIMHIEDDEIIDNNVPDDAPQSPDDDVKRRRRVVNRESVLTDFDSIIQDLENEIQNLRSTDSKSRRTTGVKFLRSTTKRLRTLKNDSARCIKTRKASNRPRNTTSGFMKPVNISNEMCKFTGWETDCPKSRVDVTKYICDYIKKKDLQNPSDRRIILPDGKLKKLLNIQKDEEDPLTYYTLQKRIQHHFSKIE